MAKSEKRMTSFGMIMSDFLIFNVRRGWGREAIHETIPLRHVTSITLEIRRYPTLGVPLALVAALAEAIAHPIGTVIATVPLSLGVLLLWGFPLVKVNTADGNLWRASGLPWTRPEAEWLVAAVKDTDGAMHRLPVDISGRI
jgi:hypothetical protein